MKFLARIVALSGVVLVAGTVHAATVSWTGSNGTWDTASDWSTGTIPVAGDDVVVGVSGVTVTYVNPANNPILNTLTIDASGAGAIFDQAQDGLSANAESIGTSNVGTFVQSGGSNTVINGLAVGGFGGGTGTGIYTLSGTGVLSAGWEYVGETGTGTVNQTGGTNATGNLYLGTDSGGSGTYTLSGGNLTVGGNIVGGSGTSDFTIDGGTLSVGGGNGSIGVTNFNVGDAGGTGNFSLSGTGSLAAVTENVGNSGIGTINQDGGTNSVGTLTLGLNGGTGSYVQSGGTNSVGFLLDLGNGGGSGSYTLSGNGLLSADYETIGDSGTGTFTQTGGTNTITNALDLAYNSGSSGTYTLSSGSLTVGGNIVGGSGNSVLTIDGGSLSVGGGNGSISGIIDFNVGDAGGAGSYTLSGTGSLSAGVENIGSTGTGTDTGTFTQTGGTNTLPADAGGVFLGSSAGVSGTYTLSGGSLSAGAEFIGENGTGTFTQTGGTNTMPVSGGILVGDQAGASGAYILSGGSLSAGAEFIGENGTGTFTQTGGTNTTTGTGNLYLGTNSGSNGTYTLSGGSLTVGGNIVGGSGTSALTIDGGTLNVGGGNGSISVTNLTVGNAVNSAGTYTQSGGTVAVGSTFFEGIFGTGSYTLSGGTLTVGAGGEIVGGLDSGIFVQSGGTNAVTGNNALIVGDGSGSSGSYALSGSGSLTATAEWIGFSGTGTFTQTGGTNTISTNGPGGTGNLTIGFASGGNGSYTLSGGSLTVGGNIVGGAGGSAFTIDGGSLSVGGGNGSISVNNFTIGDSRGAGYYALSGTGSLSATADIINNSNGTFSQYGGTENGNFINYGTFYYSGGTFNGNLSNEGVFSPSTGFTAAGAIVNDSSMTLYSGDNLTSEDPGKVGLMNNGTIGVTGNVTLSSTASGFTNNGTITVGSLGSGVYSSPQSGTLTLNVALTVPGAQDANLGNIDLIDNSELLLSSATTLSNGGSLALNGGIVGGAGTLDNVAGGTVSGPGTINTSFTNSAGVLLVQNGTTNVVGGFRNSGVVELSGLSANLSGGVIANDGTIQGNGNIGSSISNSFGSTQGGTIEASGGTLTLGGSVENLTTGLMTASSGSDLLVSGGLATNDGVINLTGGTFDNNNHALNNAGQISGYGTIRTSGLTNNGSMTLSGGTTTVNGNVTNAAGKTLTVAYNPAIFTGNVVNNGTFKTTSTTVTFAGSYTENGVFHSDPSNNYFTNLTINSSGYLLGGVGDNWFVSGNFLNYSLQNTLWNTGASSLSLDGTGSQQLLLAGANLGTSRAGYLNNFAWGSFSLASGESLTIGDGNSTPGAALYVGLFELGGGLPQLSDIVSNYNIYYDPTLAGNAYLGGKDYALNGTGQLMAVSSVPLPPAVWLFGSGLVGLFAIGRRRRGLGR